MRCLGQTGVMLHLLIYSGIDTSIRLGAMLHLLMNSGIETPLSDWCYVTSINIFWYRHLDQTGAMLHLLIYSGRDTSIRLGAMLHLLIYSGIDTSIRLVLCYIY